MATTIITKRDDRLDRICYGHYGSVAERQVEQVLDANPGLEKQPVLLPENLQITLPDIVTVTTTRVVKQVTLWSQ